MADPASIIGVITGLVELADMIFVRTFLYVKALKEKDEKISALNSEVGALFGILSRLRLLYNVMEAEGDQGGCQPVLQPQLLNNCLKTLLIIKTKLDAHRDRCDATGRHRLRSALKSLRWPFTSSEVEKLLKEIERHKANLSLALTADALSELLGKLSMQDNLCEAVHGIERTLNRITLDDQSRQILDSFGSVDFGKNHDMNRKLWRPSTGLWFTDGPDFQGWLSNKSAKNIWCYGIPGSGKTVLASAVIEEVLKHCSDSIAAAYFYCDYKDVGTQDPVNILGSLAKQLIQRSERCFQKAESLYEVHRSGKRVSTSYGPDELRDLIMQMSSIFNQTLVVVDGLDECGKNTTMVVELLSSLSKGDISSVQTLFFSRDEIEIRETLTDCTRLPIAAEKGDLQLYVAAELAARLELRGLHVNDKSIKEHIMDRLVNGANGMFRWVACQIDYLCELPDNHERCLALESLPPDLKSTYERMLRRVDETNIHVRALVQRTLRWLVVSKGELTISALREALSMKHGTQKLDRNAVPDEFVLLRFCSSLVRKSRSQVLQLAHFTVKEFLLGIDCNSEFSAYRVDVEESEVELGKACLLYLTLQDFESRVAWNPKAQRKRLQDYAFRRYAVQNWLSHAGLYLWDPELLALIQNLFHPSKSGTFATWTRDLQYLDRTRLGLAQYLISEDQYHAVVKDTPLHYASAFALPEICKWLLDYGCKVDLSSTFGTPLNHALCGPSSVEKGKKSPRQCPPGRKKEQLIKVIDILLEAGADPNSKSSLAGLTPLDYALADQDLILRLLRKGARYTEGNLQITKSLYEILLNNIGRENLHEDDYNLLLQRPVEEYRNWDDQDRSGRSLQTLLYKRRSPSGCVGITIMDSSDI